MRKSPRYTETFTFLATIRSRGGRAKHFRPSRNAILSLAGALRGLRGALWHSSHPWADPCEPSRRPHTSAPEPVGLNASSVPLRRAQPWRTFGPAAERRTNLPTSFICSLLPGTWRDCERSLVLQHSLSQSSFLPFYCFLIFFSPLQSSISCSLFHWDWSRRPVFYMLT